MNAIADLKAGLSLTSIKGDVRQPHNYAMGRIPARYSRWQTASQYLTDIERILQELKTSVSFVSTLPDDTFLLKHSVNSEDYIMYHQGYFLDLVHQLKDKLCQMVKAVVTPEDDYSEKHEKAAELSKILKDKYVLKIRCLLDYLREWDDGSHQGHISIVLKKRTLYHHYKNPLPSTDSYSKAKINRFLSSASFQSHLSDYGKQMIAEKGKQNLQSWQSDTADKMSSTLATIMTNIENIAHSLTSYYRFPTYQDSGKRVVQQYVQLDKLLEVPNSSYRIESIQQPIRGMLETLAEALPFALGQEFVALYITGSIPRGDFMWGLSDVNFVVIIKNNQGEMKDIVQHFIDTPTLAMGIPTDTRILSETEFTAEEESRIRFICRTDGLLIRGTNLLTVEKSQRICFRLAWMLNKDFKGYLASLKTLLTDRIRTPTQRQLTLMARALGKRAYRLGFSQVVGNNVRYTPHFKQMRELNNFYYPQNREFNDRTFQVFTEHPLVDRDALLSVTESMEEKLMPLYEAIDKVVNGIPEI